MEGRGEREGKERRGSKRVAEKGRAEQPAGKEGEKVTKEGEQERLEGETRSREGGRQGDREREK